MFAPINRSGSTPTAWPNASHTSRNHVIAMLQKQQASLEEQQKQID